MAMGAVVVVVEAVVEVVGVVEAVEVVVGAVWRGGWGWRVRRVRWVRRVWWRRFQLSCSVKGLRCGVHTSPIYPIQFVNSSL